MGCGEDDEELNLIGEDELRYLSSILITTMLGSSLTTLHGASQSDADGLTQF